MTELMTDSEFMRDVLQRIATGPTLSKDLSREEAQRAMRLVLDGKADLVQAGIFLIALRMKRETDDELAGILDAIHAGITPCEVAVDELLVIVDPYDGYLRSTPAAPFLPAVLAACGMKVLTHGMQDVGPKFGATHEAVLKGAACPVPADAKAAAKLIENEHCGWAYLPQTTLAPELAALQDLRTRIVKRPCLTTIEVAVNVLTPIKSAHMITGFVHKPYPPIYAQLAAQGGFASSLCIRGVEGGVVPSLSQPSRYFNSVDGQTLMQVDIRPSSIDINQSDRAVPLPAELSDNSVRSVKSPGNEFAAQLARHAAQNGLAALTGTEGSMRDSLIYAAAVILHAQGKAESLQDAAELVREVLDNGVAARHFTFALAA